MLKWYNAVHSIKTPKTRGSVSTSAQVLIGSHSWDQTNFEVRGTGRKGGDVSHGDPVLTFWRTDCEALSKAGHEEKGALSTKNLSDTGTLS